MALVNPYCSLAQVQAELRNSTEAAESELVDAINQASRWIDEYKNQDYFLHDHAEDALLIDKFDDAILRDTLFLPYKPTLTLGSVTVAEELWTLDEDYVVKENPTRLIAVGGIWPLCAATDRVAILGTFGYQQPWYVSASEIEAGGTGYTVADVLTVTGGTGTKTQLTVSAVSSGVITAVTISRAGAYTAKPTDPTEPLAVTGGTGSGATFNLTWGILTSEVPTGLPAHINKAAILTAAALSGHNQKEIIGLDGERDHVITKSIPKTVYDLLGRRAVLL